MWSSKLFVCLATWTRGIAYCTFALHLRSSQGLTFVDAFQYRYKSAIIRSGVEKNASKEELCRSVLTTSVNYSSSSIYVCELECPWAWLRNDRWCICVVRCIPAQPILQSLGKYLDLWITCTSLGHKVTEAAARGAPRPLTFNVSGGRAAAICAHRKKKKGYSLFVWKLVALYERDLQPKAIWYANLFIVVAWPYNIQLVWRLSYKQFKPLRMSRDVHVKICWTQIVCKTKSNLAPSVFPATAVLHKNLPRPMYILGFLLLSWLPGTLTPSLTCGVRIDLQSKLTKWKQAAHPWPRRADVKRKERDGNSPY